MRRIAQDVEQLVVRVQRADEFPDVLVLGSGYGGAVAAARFAAQGHSVWLLERGQEYLAGDFPTDWSQAPGHVRTESPQRQQVRASGYEDALFDFRLGDGANALVGNGLGGGSLINAAVALRPDARVFDRSDWPAALRDLSTWTSYFDRAEAGLGVQGGEIQRQSSHCVPQHTPKRQRLEELAQTARERAAEKDVRVTLKDVPLAIEFRRDPPQRPAPLQACIGCGNCVSGCNHNAKKSLDKTYLACARQDGAALYTGVTALWLEHDKDHAYPWIVHCVRSSERGLWADVAVHEQPPAPAGYVFQVRAKNVVVAGGTFGSTELLLRSRLQGLRLPRSLGRRISANGDDLSAAYDLPAHAGGIGARTTAGSTPAPAARIGPTISGVIHFDHQDDVTRSTVTEDGGIPGLLRAPATEMLGTLGMLPQLERWGLRHGGAADPLAVQQQAIAGSLALLGMGHDGANGQAALVSLPARLSWCWNGRQGDTAPALHRQRLGAIEDLGGLFLPNPYAGLLPDAMADTLSGPPAPSNWITVHPLGGCRMADSPEHGVVDHRCRVYRPDGDVYEGLYVMDGSVLPSSLGVNPLLTITAVAERACALAQASSQAGAKAASSPPTASAPPAPAHTAAAPVSPPAGTSPAPGVPHGSSLNEVLRGPLAWHSARAQGQFTGQTGPHGASAAALFLEMDIRDWAQLWNDARHETPVTPGSTAPITNERDFTRSRLLIDRPGQPSLTWPVTGGRVQVLPLTRAGFVLRCERFVRVLLTYALGRWLPDRKRAVAPPSSGRPAPNLCQKVKGALKACWHATATRGFNYALEIDAAGTPLRLQGGKFIDPSASWHALWRALKYRLRTGKYTVVERRSVWDQLTQLDVKLMPAHGSQVLASGRLDMDMPEMVRRVAPQLKDGPDAVHALTAFLSYPALIARHLLIAHLLDFRLPDYKTGLPATDPASESDALTEELDAAMYPALRLANGALVGPQPPVHLTVPLHAAKPHGQQIRVGLVRYRQPRVPMDAVNGQRRYRAILLMNGFAQNTRPFAAPELGNQNLATLLYEQGWDVWLFEYRVSPLLRASARFSSMDDIAAGDVPAAVRHVIGALDMESGAASRNSQVFMFSHCVGSASLAMSLLGGHLRHPDKSSMLAGVLFSQFQPFVVGSATSQMRLQVAPVLTNALGLDYLQFSAGTVQADAAHAFLDRLFASFHYDAAERCPHEHDLARPQPDTASCKRMAGLLSRLFRHDQLHLETHEKLDLYFGRANLGVFLHGAKCVDNERLVNADGQNIYVTEHNIRAYLDMPLMLLHGDSNVLFDPQSLLESQRQLSRAFSPQRIQSGRDRFFIAPQHAHFDCTIGKRAPTVIFPQVLEFFDQAYEAPAAPPGQPDRLRARLPRTGPLIGWTRREADTMTMRVWIEVDDSQADEAVAAMTVLCVDGQRHVQCWPIEHVPLHTTTPLAQPADGQTTGHGLRYALADLCWPARARGTVRVAMVSLHRYSDGADALPPPPAGWNAPAAWGVPMTQDEALRSEGRTPSHLDHRIPASIVLPAGPARPRRPASVRPPSALAALAPASTPHAVSPVNITLSLADAHALLRPLATVLAIARHTALQAQPGTLSRRLRTIRTLREAWMRVPPATWRDDRSEVRLLLATCRHPGLSTLELWRRDTQLLALARRQQAQPAAMMWMMGDQIYADASAGLADSPSPVERFLPRYREAFGSPGFRALARQLPLYMVMDDHEIADNWSRDRLRAGAMQPAFFANAHTAFQVFQQSHGPGGLAASDAGMTWRGLPFYRLDTRLNRRRVPVRQMLLPAQWAQLEQWLLAQQRRGAQPKFIASGSVFAPGLLGNAGNPSPRQGDTWQSCAEERARLLDFIADNRIENVVFLSGDYHCSAAATLEFSDSSLRAYALVCPPLYAPMAFANVTPEEIMAAETIALATRSVQVRAQAFAGEGWLECAVRPTAAQTWQLDARFQCTPPGTGTTNQAAYATAVGWTLGSISSVVDNPDEQ